MRVVDSSAIIERMVNGSLRDRIEPLLPAAEEWLVPTMVQFEVTKWLMRSSYPDPSRAADSILGRFPSIPMTQEIAEAAAECWDRYKLATADAIIYATARVHGADLLTCDRHFEGLPAVIYLAKLPN